MSEQLAHVSSTVPQKIKTWIDEKSKKEFRTPSSIIRIILTKEFEREKKQQDKK